MRHQVDHLKHLSQDRPRIGRLSGAKQRRDVGQLRRGGAHVGHGARRRARLQLAQLRLDARALARVLGILDRAVEIEPLQPLGACLEARALELGRVHLAAALLGQRVKLVSDGGHEIAVLHERSQAVDDMRLSRARLHKLEVAARVARPGLLATAHIIAAPLEAQRHIPHRRAAVRAAGQAREHGRTAGGALAVVAAAAPGDLILHRGPGLGVDKRGMRAGVFLPIAPHPTGIHRVLEHLLDLELGERPATGRAVPGCVQRIGHAGIALAPVGVERKGQPRHLGLVVRLQHPAHTVEAERQRTDVPAGSRLGRARIAHLLGELVALRLSDHREHAKGQAAAGRFAVDRLGRRLDLNLVTLELGGGLVLDQHLAREAVHLVDERDIKLAGAGVGQHLLERHALLHALGERTPPGLGVDRDHLPALLRGVGAAERFLVVKAHAVFLARAGYAQIQCYSHRDLR